MDPAGGGTTRAPQLGPALSRPLSPGPSCGPGTKPYVGLTSVCVWVVGLCRALTGHPGEAPWLWGSSACSGAFTVLCGSDAGAGPGGSWGPSWVPTGPVSDTERPVRHTGQPSGSPGGLAGSPAPALTIQGPGTCANTLVTSAAAGLLGPATSFLPWPLADPQRVREALPQGWTPRPALSQPEGGRPGGRALSSCSPVAVCLSHLIRLCLRLVWKLRRSRQD